MFRRSSLLVVALLLGAVPVLAAPTSPKDQSSVKGFTVYRRIDATTRKLATDANTPWCHWCPDSTGGVSKIDTLGTCRRLLYDAVVAQWKPRMSAVSPNGTYFRQAGTVYFRSTSPSVVDTVAAGPGAVPDTHRPTIEGVDSIAVGEQVIEPVHIDSTATYPLEQVRADKITIKEVGSGKVGISVPSGTAATSSTVLEIGGAGGFDEGKAIYLRDWSGPGLYLTRKSGGPTTPSDAVTLDMSAEAYTSGQLYGIAVDYGGTGKVSALSFRRSSGSRSFDVWGSRVETTNGATQSGGTNYGGSFITKAAVSGAGKNIAGYFEATTGGGGRALRTVGDSELGSGTSDTLLVRQPARFDYSVTLAGQLRLVKSVDGGFLYSGTLAASDTTVLVTIPDAAEHDFYSFSWDGQVDGDPASAYWDEADKVRVKTHRAVGDDRNFYILWIQVP